MDEGMQCRYLDCPGLMFYREVENCRCHINPPCSTCENNPLICDYCYEEESMTKLSKEDIAAIVAVALGHPSRIAPGMVVEQGGRLGVTRDDPYGSCGKHETPVVFYGQCSFEAVPTVDLKIIGPENAVPEPKACGAGQGADCCIFLTVGATGFNCERFGSLRDTLVAKGPSMSAQRLPLEPFPKCQTGTP